MKQNPVDDLTPAQIVQELDRYIVGQHAAKRAVAVALRNRYRRLQLPAADRGDVLPKNILMIGPTGVGKTEIARRLAQLSHAPLVKVEATKFTEVGYVGRDVESMVRDLAAAAVRLVEQERIEASQPQAEAMAVQNIADQILEKRRQDSFDSDNPDELAFSHQIHDRDLGRARGRGGRYFMDGYSRRRAWRRDHRHAHRVSRCHVPPSAQPSRRIAGEYRDIASRPFPA